MKKPFFEDDDDDDNDKLYSYVLNHQIRPLKSVYAAENLNSTVILFPLVACSNMAKGEEKQSPCPKISGAKNISLQARCVFFKS